MIAEINEFSVFAEIGMGQLAVNAFIDPIIMFVKVCLHQMSNHLHHLTAVVIIS